MIDLLRISNLGVIRESELEFTPGLNVLTGETGAGKTMIFRSLSLLLGGKADSSLVSTGADQAVVEAEISVSESIAREIDDVGGTLEDGRVALCSRQLNAGGKSRAFIGGRALPSAQMAEIGEQLVAIHGQSDQLRLTKPAAQRTLLDRFGGSPVAKELTAYQEAWDELVSTDAKILSLSSDSATRLAELERLTKIFSDIEKLDPQPDEDIELSDEARRLTFSEALHEASSTAVTALDGGDDDSTNVLSLLHVARKGLEHEQELDSLLTSFVTRVREAQTVIADIAADLRTYRAGIDGSPERLAYVEARRADLKIVSREFGDVNDLLAWAQENKNRLAELSGGDELLEELRVSRELLAAVLQTRGDALTKLRKKAAKDFSAQVSAELEHLAMGGAKVEFVIDAGKPDRNGADSISMGLISRPDSPLVPIAKGASGGELSRIMLAVQVVLASSDPIGTFVFDEIDAGVGGQAAIEVGKRLAKLAQSAQVIVVTHLPQVAAFAANHLVIARGDGQEVHSSSVTRVKDDERVTEIARMLAGLSGSSASEALAQELLDVAANFK